MATRPSEQLLYDSEASLRLVDQAIEELDKAGFRVDEDSQDFLTHVMSQPSGFDDLSKTLLRAYAEAFGIAQQLKQQCDEVDADANRLLQLHGRLYETSNAADRAQEMEKAAALLSDLRKRIAEIANAFG